MPSKKRGGLSKRELAAKQKSLVQPKSTVRKAASKSPWGADLSGEGRMTNSQYEANIASGLGNAASVNAAKSAAKLSSSPSKQREAASKAYKPKSSPTTSPLNSLLGVKTANAAESAPNGVNYDNARLTPTTRKQSTGILRAIDVATDPFGIKSKLRQGGFNIPGAPDLGISEALGLNKNIETGLANYTDDQGQVLGVEDQQSMYDYNRFAEENPNVSVSPNEYIYNKRGVDSGLPSAPFTGTGRKTFLENKNKPVVDDSESTYTDPGSPWGVDLSGEGNTDKYPSNPLADYLNTDPANTPLTDTPGATVGNRSGRGMGMFATGKGVGNPADQDPYMAEMRRALKGYGAQEKSAKKQIEDLIRALDPTYDEYQSDIKKSIDQELNDNLVKLASVMNANNTGDSEQRVNIMAGMQRDAGAQLGDLIRKLMLDKQEKISGYRTKGVDTLNSIRERASDARLNFAKLLKDAKDTAWDREYKMASLNSKGEKPPKNMSLKAIGFDKFGNENRWIDQSTGDIYEQDDF